MTEFVIGFKSGRRIVLPGGTYTMKQYTQNLFELVDELGVSTGLVISEAEVEFMQDQEEMEPKYNVKDC
jgi:hypothetical protein